MRGSQIQSSLDSTSFSKIKIMQHYIVGEKANINTHFEIITSDLSEAKAVAKKSKKPLFSIEPNGSFKLIKWA